MRLVGMADHPEGQRRASVKGIRLAGVADGRACHDLER